MITIKGTQFADNEQDSVELTTVGRLYQRARPTIFATMNRKPPVLTVQKPP